MNERSQRILNSIKAKGLSYADLEYLTGVSKSALQRYATGQTIKIPIDVIEKIAAATGVSSRYLMCWDDEDTQDFQFHVISERAEQMKKQNAPDDEVRGEIMKMISGLSDSQAKQLRDFLKGMLPE